MKKILALALALMMILGLATTASAATVTVKQTGHTYEAYQILTGTQGESETALGDVVWGNGIDAEAFLTALKADETVGTVFAAATDAKSFSEALATLADNSEGAKAVAAIADANKVDAAAIELNEGENELLDGYYLIVDTTNVTGENDSKNASLLQVTRDITIADKSAKPSVDKQVQDEVDDKDINSEDAAGWGETADHAINESFQFKLIATLPADEDFDAYETYKIVFNDTMSDGITFEEIVSVKVNDTAITDYDYTATAGQAGGSWSLTIEDIKDYDADLTNGAVIEVIYKAHLNEAAVTGNVDDNKNTVNLQYSNNPNADADGDDLGQTPDDTVWVFTYEIDSVKYADEAVAGKELAGAGFTLYPSADGTAKGEAVKLVYDETKAAYRPASAEEIAAGAENIVTEMTSAENGVFNVYGLDIGTYILEETKVPAGYNKCVDIVIEITAEHKEIDAENAETVIKFNGEDPAVNNVINKSGAVLPETGGMGTTLFYVIGGLLVAAAVVLLVTKKRMASAE